MRVGVFTFATDRDMSPARLAAEVEARGFTELMFTEHSHVPASRATPYPDVYGGGVLPDFYKRTYDPFVACSFAAAATTTLQVGTGICLLALRDPIHTAKEVASVDRLSGGRFVFGVGFGWNADEFVSHGVDFEQRHAIVEDRLQLMRALWTDDVASYDGVHARLGPSWAWPKPIQRPYPPIYLGGNGPRAMRHAARWADAWYPTTLGAYRTPAQALDAFRAVVVEAGRDPDSVPVGVATASVTASELAAYQDAGLERVDVLALAASDDELLRGLDGLAKLRDDVL
jgi:probable F420-dependent oxidoreductase